ncbi:MAG: hypothetical protein E7014_04270 [Alphaproteobacteria bacterium]|nr:hypothetical protein [Alphaproteobacteria bacterium]
MNVTTLTQNKKKGKAMIQIYVKNSLFRDTLMNALTEFNPTLYNETDSVDNILLLNGEQQDIDEFLKNPPQYPVILLGGHHSESDVEISLPCSLNELKGHIKNLLQKQQNAPSFENKHFLFEGSHRLLTHKKSQTQIHLTEKETQMIVYLIKSLPESVSRVDLLTEVWNYRPDSETHTVETHIYALRQKIGESNADKFITNTSDGYILVQS